MTGAIILAAGASSRMGQSKQMLDIHGEKLLVKAIQTVLRSKISTTLVVLGSGEENHRALIKDMAVESAYNPHWARGMGSSIKTGLQQLLAIHADTDAVVIFVCDQPLLDADVINKLIDKYRETKKPIIASKYAGAPGVPVLFDKSYFQRLRSLSDEEGAKKIVLQNLEDVVLVPFPGGEIDLDTMEDYKAFTQRKL